MVDNRGLDLDEGQMRFQEDTVEIYHYICRVSVLPLIIFTQGTYMVRGKHYCSIEVNEERLPNT